MRAIVLTFAAAFSSVAAAGPVAGGPDEAVGQQRPLSPAIAAEIRNMRTAARALEVRVQAIRADVPEGGIPCSEDAACFDGYLSGFAAWSMADKTAGFAQARDLPMMITAAEVAGHQALFAYDAFTEIGEEIRSPAACDAAKQSAVIVNAAVSIVEMACEESNAATCFEYPEEGVARLELPECGAGFEVGPNGRPPSP